MLSFIPDNTGTLLDIGCAEGFFAASVRNKYPTCETWGVEPLASAAGEAKKRLDNVICGRLEDATLLPSRYLTLS